MAPRQITQIEINISDISKYSKRIIHLLKYHLNVYLCVDQAMLTPTAHFVAHHTAPVV